MTEGAKLALNLAAVLVIAAVAFKYFFVEVVVIDHNGMAPTLLYGDQVLVWRDAAVELADIVLCEHPAREDVDVIGRAIAFTGSRVWSDHNGQLYVNSDQASTEGGRVVDFNDVPRKRHLRMAMVPINYFGKHDHLFFMQEGHKLSLRSYTIEDGVYLLGDNRLESDHDSRAFGEVDTDTCWGQVIMRLQPSKVGRESFDHGYFELID